MAGMKVKLSQLLVPLVYSTLVLITLPLMYSQVIIATHGVRSGLSSIQIATLFSNAPILLSFLGSYHKRKAENWKMGQMLCLSTGLLALFTVILSCIPLTGSMYSYLGWMAVLSGISTCCFVSQLSCYAIIHTSSISLPPSIKLIDTTHAISAAVGMIFCYYLTTLLDGSGLLLFSAALIIIPPLLLWGMCIDDCPVPKMFKYDEEECNTTDFDKTYFNDERIKNDLLKDNPYLLMENDSFGRTLIDTDAQVIIIINIFYVVMVAISHGVHCFFLVTMTEKSDKFTLDKCCFLYTAGVIMSSALCALVRPLLSRNNIGYKILALLYLTLSNVVSLFLMSDLDSAVWKYLLSYCSLVSNCQLLEDVIDAIITNYYDNIGLPAMKSFPVTDYINAKVAFLHGLGAVAGSLIFGLIANDLEVETLLFTVAAIYTTLSVVTTPLSLLFVAADLR